MTRTVRFKVSRGHLEPLEPVPLVEGTEVDVAVPVEPKKSTTASLLAIMESRPGIDPSIVDELERAIESGKVPGRTEGVFDDLKE
jgi:predicted DNA-binding antitoxin AbrB/MazE fold protein